MAVDIFKIPLRIASSLHWKSVAATKVEVIELMHQIIFRPAEARADDWGLAK